jgi:hypothetical protein
MNPDTANQDNSSSPPKEFSNSWILIGWKAIFFDKKLQSSQLLDLDAIRAAWIEKQKNIFFDKKINLIFQKSDNFCTSWINLEKAFDKLRSNEMLYVNNSSVFNTDEAKRSGGASKAIDTEKIKIGRDFPNGIMSADAPLSITGKSVAIHIFPTFAFVKYFNSTTIVSLVELKTFISESTIIGKAPADAEITDQTWSHVNVSGSNAGSKDKRIKNNSLLDKYLVGRLTISVSESEKPIEFIFSKRDGVDDFFDCFKRHRNQVRDDQLDLMV